MEDPVRTLALPCLMNPRTNNATFLFLTHTKQLLLATFCDMTAGIGNLKGLRDAASG